jgi:hypothetical protein
MQPNAPCLEKGAQRVLCQWPQDTLIRDACKRRTCSCWLDTCYNCHSEWPEDVHILWCTATLISWMLSLICTRFSNSKATACSENYEFCCLNSEITDDKRYADSWWQQVLGAIITSLSTPETQAELGLGSLFYIHSLPKYLLFLLGELAQHVSVSKCF